MTNTISNTIRATATAESDTHRCGEYLIHSGSGIDVPDLIGEAGTLPDARAIAERELARYPDHIVTIIDRFGAEHPVRAK